ncbi:hypothetical protein ACTJIJ_02570 [Niabella sp. 22666]|uniref:hypothetical protein n=1 Tax=Niabella sp. 22666 TaxID=3453954 RepID=UPI003F844737
MFRFLIKTFPFFLLVFILSCKKKEVVGITNFEPDIPVHVLNKQASFTVPVVTGSKASGQFSIELGIPQSSGRTIKEISRVVYSSAANGAGILLKTPKDTQVVAQGIYLKTPIAGNGTKVTFTSSFDEFKTRTLQTSATAAAAAVPEPTANNALINRWFHFLVTLDDGTQIIPMGVRVLVVP